MKKYLISEEGNFYKANLHCHSTFSDGEKTPEEIKIFYQKMGYSVVAYTDHDILVAHDELTDENFLALHGYEVEIPSDDDEIGYVQTCHLCFIGIDPNNLFMTCFNKDKYIIPNAQKHIPVLQYDKDNANYTRKYCPECVNDMIKQGKDAGFFVTYNHPTWSREQYPVYSQYKNMSAVEIFNGACINDGYDDFNPRVYEDFLRQGEFIYCVGGDDNHNRHPDNSRHCDSGKAFTVIKANSLNYADVTKALVNGNFYASEGPEIYELTCEDNKVHIKCSDADKISISAYIRYAESVMAEDEKPINEATFVLPENCVWFRLTVTDRHGKKACTNAYKIEDIKK